MKNFVVICPICKRNGRIPEYTIKLNSTWMECYNYNYVYVKELFTGFLNFHSI